MDSSLLERKFGSMGARVKIKNRGTTLIRGSVNSDGVRLNVLSDKKGEFFEVAVNEDNQPEVQILDVQPSDRHLLLMVRNHNGNKSKFLMGHDERGLFVAAIPESAPVGTVRQAKESLKPQGIQEKQIGLNAKKRNKRKNAVYHRQGEWFFTPANIAEPDTALVLKNEPITRGTGSKPHMCEFMYRRGGEAVYVCSRYPSGVNVDIYNRLIRTNKDAKSYGWRQMIKDAAVYVKGNIRHSDHKTIRLKVWSLVQMNTENKAAAMRQVAFLD